MGPITRTVTLTNPTGLHARPASLFVHTASRFPATITVAGNGKTGNGKSILSVLSLGLTQGDSLTITVEGDQAEEAMAALMALIERNFEQG